MRQAAATTILRDLAADEVIIPVQALGELFTLLIRKVRRPAPDVRAAVLGWRDAYSVAETSSEVLIDAMELAAGHQFALWDAINIGRGGRRGSRAAIAARDAPITTVTLGE